MTLSHRRTLYLSSPAAQMIIIWAALCVMVAFGPIDYGGQPSPAVLGLISAGIAIFLIGCRGGRMLSEGWFARQAQVRPPSSRALDRVVIAASLLGILGIGLLALDRSVLSGISNEIGRAHV